MTRKLAYSAEAFARRSLISKEAALFIIVEGRDTDAPFYSKIAKTSDLVVKRGYQVWLIEQIGRQVPGTPAAKFAGGKPSMLALFDSYKAANSLTFVNSAGRRSIVFCMDRDADDVAGRTRRSKHVIYTPMADAEATLYANADMSNALASALSLDEKSVDNFLSTHPDWMLGLAARWREWIELACLAAAHHAHCHVSTRKLSAVNVDHYGAVVPNEISKAQQIIDKKSQVPAHKRPALNQKVRARIARLYASGNGHRLLGKHWLSAYLLHLLNRHFAGAPVGLSGFVQKMPVALMAETNFKAAWASMYRRKFESLI